MSRETNTKNVPSPVTDGFKTFIRIIDANVLPILAWVVLVGLAVRGAMNYFANMTPQIQVIAAIAIVAFLAFKLR